MKTKKKAQAGAKVDSASFYQDKSIRMLGNADRALGAGRKKESDAYTRLSKKASNDASRVSKGKTGPTISTKKCGGSVKKAKKK